MKRYNLREELLIKAQRDKSKLVQVQRTVSRGGRTFTQNFWVLPSQVKKTDRVIGGQQNLLPAAGSVPVPAAGVLDKAYLDSIKSDKTKALAYIKSCGIVWNEHPTHEGVNWMRAMMAVSSALNGQKTVKIAPNQPTTQANISTQQIAQNSQVIVDKVKADAMLDQATKDELNKCQNGREKVVVLKKRLGQDGCMQYAKMMGITWNEHNHPSINVMRMSMALQQSFDAADGTVSPSTKGQGGGAPNGNQNAKKNTQPKVDPDKLKIPANATQRTVNLINLINSVDSVDDLKTYTGVGMIPEDDVAKSFIFDKLSPKYEAFKQSKQIKSSKSTTATKLDVVGNSSTGFARLLTSNLGIEGCKKDVIYNGFASWYQRFRVACITDPRSILASAFDSGSYVRTRNKTIYSYHLIKTLQEAFSKYTTDEYTDEYKTNLGYTGWNSDICRKQYDHSKDGFVRYLNRIVEENPDTKSQVEAMITQYDRLMEKAGYNPLLLEKVLETTNWSTGENPGEKHGLVCRSWDLEVEDIVPVPADAKETLKHMNYLAEVVPRILANKGLSQKSIENTLGYGWNDNLSYLYIIDENGNRAQQRLDITKEINPDTGKPYFDGYSPNSDSPRDFHAHCCDGITMNYVYEQYVHPGVINDRRTKRAFEKLNAIASVSQEDYAEIHKLASQLFGEKLIYVGDNGEKFEGTDFSYEQLQKMKTSSHVDMGIEKDGDNPQLDLILANLNLAYCSVLANKSIEYDVYKNSRSSLNHNGSDYSKNFSFYYPSDTMKQHHKRLTTDYYGNNPSEYLSDELNAQIDNQMKITPTVSPEYIRSLTEYYNAQCGYDADKVALTTRVEGLGSVGQGGQLSLKDYVQNPLKDILFAASKNLLANIPKMNSPKLDVAIAKKLDYIPYDFTATTQPTLSSLSGKSGKSSPVDKTELRQVREAALKAINCSIAVEDEATSLQMRKDFLKNWDYQDGGSEKDPDGTVHTHRIYSGAHSHQGHDRRALFNSRFFKVNNSNMQDDFEKYATELSADTSLSSSSYEKLHLYHACSYAATAGILGVTGGWFMGNQYTKAGKALGNGAYFGYKGGKSSVYCGDAGYANLSRLGAQGDGANGCFILADVMRGRPGDSRSDGGAFRDWEMVVRTNKCILPHHFVDISARSLGVNVTRDTEGNYLDETGQITHDKYGTSITMK